MINHDFRQVFNISKIDSKCFCFFRGPQTQLSPNIFWEPIWSKKCLGGSRSSFVLALFMEFSDLWPIDEFMWEFLFYVFACRGSEVDDLVLEDSKLVFVVAILFMHTHVICFRCICLLLRFLFSSMVRGRAFWQVRRNSIFASKSFLGKWRPHASGVSVSVLMILFRCWSHGNVIVWLLCCYSFHIALFRICRCSRVERWLADFGAIV